MAHSGGVQELFLCVVFDDGRGLAIVTFVLVNEETWSLYVPACVGTVRADEAVREPEPVLTNTLR